VTAAVCRHGFAAFRQNSADEFLANLLRRAAKKKAPVPAMIGEGPGALNGLLGGLEWVQTVEKTKGLGAQILRTVQR
jgi:hypothetical protein